MLASVKHVNFAVFVKHTNFKMLHFMTHGHYVVLGQLGARDDVGPNVT